MTVNVGNKCSTDSHTNLCPSLCRCFQGPGESRPGGKVWYSGFLCWYTYTLPGYFPPCFGKSTHVLIFAPNPKWYTVYDKLYITFQPPINIKHVSPPYPPLFHRQTGMGASSMFARIFGILAIIINLLYNQSPAVPQLIFGTSALLVAGLALTWPSHCLKQSLSSPDPFQTEWRRPRTGIWGIKIAVKQPLCLPIPSFIGFAVKLLPPVTLFCCCSVRIFDTFIWLSSDRNSSSKEQELQCLATQADKCLTGFMFPLFTPSKFRYMSYSGVDACCTARNKQPPRILSSHSVQHGCVKETNVDISCVTP